MKVFKDKGDTRINLSSITSYSKDYDLVHPNGKVDILVLTIGSALKRMSYNDTKSRDQDFSELDSHFNVRQ